MKRNYHHPTFVQYKKKSHQFISSLHYKKNSIRKNKLKWKKLKLEISSIETN
jgi:hypothetical protein